MSPNHPPPKFLNVLIIGANGYIGSAIGRAFLRTHTPNSTHFRVFGLIRRATTAPSIAKDEIIPLVGTIPPPSSLQDSPLLQTILTHSKTWDVIVTATEPAFTDSAEVKKQHWDGVLGLVKELAAVSGKEGVRPFVLWSSGCKDYGTTGLDGEVGVVRGHDESSEVVDHVIIRERTEAALGVLRASKKDGEGGFDVAVVRATPVFGYSGSYLGAGFDYVRGLYESEVGRGVDKPVLRFVGQPGTIIHAVHVDDCAEGYVAIAGKALFRGEEGRRAVSGDVFNISGRRYETLRETAEVLAAEYGFGGGVEYGVAEDQLPEGVSVLTSQMVFGWSQWVASDKIRRVTGWTDRRPLFAENLHVYRLAYEAVSGEEVDDNVKNMKKRLGGST